VPTPESAAAFEKLVAARTRLNDSSVDSKEALESRRLGALMRDGNQEIFATCKEANLALAKFYILADARNRHLSLEGLEFPTEDTLLDSWEPVTF